jgi:hypothetical protein
MLVTYVSFASFTADEFRTFDLAEIFGENAGRILFRLHCIADLLEAPDDNKDVKPVRQMKEFYNLCMDTGN